MPGCESATTIGFMDPPNQLEHLDCGHVPLQHRPAALGAAPPSAPPGVGAQDQERHRTRLGAVRLPDLYDSGAELRRQPRRERSWSPFRS